RWDRICPGVPMSSSSIPDYGFRVVEVFPHDPNESTEGLFYLGGFLYESSGQTNANAISNLRKVDIATGVPVKNVELDPSIFAEGIAPWNNSIFMVTYQNYETLVFDINDLTRRKGSFKNQTEGWGLTEDGTNLIMSDGSPTIRFFDPASFSQTKSIQVKNGNVPWPGANELEYVNGEIWANLDGRNQIARISPSDGTIL